MNKSVGNIKLQEKLIYNKFCELNRGRFVRPASLRWCYRRHQVRRRDCREIWRQCWEVFYFDKDKYKDVLRLRLNENVVKPYFGLNQTIMQNFLNFFQVMFEKFIFETLLLKFEDNANKKLAAVVTRNKALVHIFQTVHFSHNLKVLFLLLL